MKTTLNAARFLLLFALLLSTKSSWCQTFEIRLNNKGLGVLSVEMRETSGATPKTSDYVTDIVFGIKWRGDGLDFTNNLSTVFNIKKSGSRTAKNGFYFQAFYADPVGFLLPANWQQNGWVEIVALSLSGTGTGSFDICEKGFDVTTDPNFALNFTDYTPTIAGSTVTAPLPVKLTRFDVTAGSSVIKIFWITENELNNRGFEVQRSTTNANEFFKVGWINGKASGNASNEYAFIDKNVIPKQMYSYRLKQFDLDGLFKYSEIKTAVLDEFDNPSISIAPNPADKVLLVSFKSYTGREMLTVKIIDAKGSVVSSWNRQVNLTPRIELNISALTSGSYFLIIENKKGLVYAKVFQKS